MCEPLSVGVYACRRANVSPETTVLILGAGPIGLVTLLAACAFGAPKVVVVDVDDHRLSVAKELGAAAVVKVSSDIQVLKNLPTKIYPFRFSLSFSEANVKCNSVMQDVDKEVEEIKKAMGGAVDVTVDCCGMSKTVSTALAATASGGKVCVVGMAHCQMTVPLTPAAAR